MSLPADPNRDGCSREQTAYLMGHESIRTATVYGVSNQGKKGRREYLLPQHQLTTHQSEPQQPRPAYA